jgi:hypothetical protein
MDTGEYVAIKRIKRNQMECDDMVRLQFYNLMLVLKAF